MFCSRKCWEKLGCQRFHFVSSAKEKAARLDWRGTNETPTYILPILHLAQNWWNDPECKTDKISKSHFCVEESLYFWWRLWNYYNGIPKSHFMVGGRGKKFCIFDLESKTDKIPKSHSFWEERCGGGSLFLILSQKLPKSRSPIFGGWKAVGYSKLVSLNFLRTTTFAISRPLCSKYKCPLTLCVSVYHKNLRTFAKNIAGWNLRVLWLCS